MSAIEPAGSVACVWCPSRDRGKAHRAVFHARPRSELPSRLAFCARWPLIQNRLARCQVSDRTGHVLSIGESYDERC